MRPCLAIAALLAGTCGVALAAEAEIDRFVEAEMALNSIPGLSLAIVEHGTVSYLGAFGARSVESQEPMRVSTPVELASVSKSLTALAILQLERAGRLERDGTVLSILPELGADQWRDVTLHDLLRHRSGLRRRHDYLVPCCGKAGSLDLEVVAEHMSEADLQSAPGQTFSYANSNYFLLAAAAQRASGVSFPVFMRQNVFEPLGMHRTTVLDAEGLKWMMAVPHEWLWGNVRTSPSRFRGWYGSSRVKASAEDMGAYIATLLDPQKGLLGFQGSARPWWQQLAPDYDLGWTVHAEPEWLDGEMVLEHTGKIWGGNTAVVLAPRRRAGVAVLINLGTGRASPVARALLRSLSGTPLPQAERMSLSENPDTWAQVFLVGSIGLFSALLWYCLRLSRQFRLGTRAWQPTGWRIGRAAVLVVLAIKLVQIAVWPAGPPLTAFPSTVRVALPVLVVAVTVLLLFGAAAGLTESRGKRASFTRL